jgi:aminopeptidase N
MSDKANLTREEAAARAAMLEVPRTVAHVDLSGDDGGEIRTFRARSILHLTVHRSGSTFVDVDAETVLAVRIDGVDVPVETAAGRVLLPTLTVGSHTVEVTAVMNYSRSGRGLHRFVDPTDGVVYLHSQFEPFHALQVLPCFDQPDLKTSLELTVIAPADWLVISNEGAIDAAPTTSATSPSTDGAALCWTFAPTPPISTYLFALVAGGYVARTDRYVRPDGTSVPLGLFIRRSLEQHLETEELFDLTRAGLTFFEATFGTYPFAKYDQLFVPEFSAGAMENPGAVTFTETYVFRAKVTDTIRERRAETFLHEMAHMWFGDLVTMRWWDDLWLNESFATFMSVLAMTSATRWSDAWVTFLDAEKTWAKFQDQLPSTHPIADEMPDVESVHQNFDGITYAKGASVLRQLVAWVGQDAFLAGCRDYFERHAWGNTTLADFLAALERASGRDLTAWRDEWLRTTGVNVLTPEVTVSGDGTYSAVAIRQTDPAPLWRPDGHVPVLRRHRLAVGIYDLVDGQLSRRERVELDVEGSLTPVGALTGVRAGDLLLLNDDDLTFARIMLDEGSLATATAHLAAISDPMPRALVWSAAWDMLRDATLSSSTFVDLVARNLAPTEQVGTLQRLLMRAAGAVERYAAPEHREVLRARLREQARAALASVPAGGDHQLAWFRHWAGLASEPEDIALLHSVLEDRAPFEGLVVDVDLRWHVIIALAHAGAIDDVTVAAELARDDTDLGQRQALTARAIRPDAAAKEQAWQRLMTDPDLSHTLGRQIWGGFNQLDQEVLLAPYTERYFAALRAVWDARPLDFTIEFAAGMFPHAALGADLLARTDAALAEPDLPRPLRRVLLEQRDTVVRTLRTRELDASGA